MSVAVTVSGIALIPILLQSTSSGQPLPLAYFLLFDGCPAVLSILMISRTSINGLLGICLAVATNRKRPRWCVR